jgi:hypothetical protein
LTLSSEYQKTLVDVGRTGAGALREFTVKAITFSGGTAEPSIPIRLTVEVQRSEAPGVGLEHDDRRQPSLPAKPLATRDPDAAVLAISGRFPRKAKRSDGFAEAARGRHSLRDRSSASQGVLLFSIEAH